MTAVATVECVEQIEPTPFRFTTEQFQQMVAWGWFRGQQVELVDGVVFDKNPTDDSGPARPHLWSSVELYQILDANWFIDHRVELIEGEILEMPAQKNYHAMSISMTDDALRIAFGPGYWVRIQMSLDLRPRSTPDPDLAVVLGNMRTHNPNYNPTTALLIGEVSETTLYFDRRAKGSLYAASGIADYWIVNLVQRQLEIYRNPVVDTTKVYGYYYADRMILDSGDYATPLALPNAKIAVADLLP